MSPSVSFSPLRLARFQDADESDTKILESYSSVRKICPTMDPDVTMREVIKNYFSDLVIYFYISFFKIIVLENICCYM